MRYHNNLERVRNMTRRTVIDLYISNTPYEGEQLKIEYYATFADFPKRGATVSTSRDGAVDLAFAEMDALFDANVLFIRYFDTYYMDFDDYYRDVEAQLLIESIVAK